MPHKPNLFLFFFGNWGRSFWKGEATLTFSELQINGVEGGHQQIDGVSPAGPIQLVSSQGLW